MGRPLLGWQFQLRALTAQRGGELLQMRFSDLHNRGTHWIKPFVIRKRKKTAVRQDPYLIPLAPMAVTGMQDAKLMGCRPDPLRDRTAVGTCRERGGPGLDPKSALREEDGCGCRATHERWPRTHVVEQFQSWIPDIRR